MFRYKHHRGDAENVDPAAGNNGCVTAWETRPLVGSRVAECR